MSSTLCAVLLSLTPVVLSLQLVPSDEDGKDTLLRPRNFQIAGIPVLDQEIPFVLCASNSCRLLHKIRRSHCSPHNSLRNLVEDFASDAMLSPEKKGILDNTPLVDVQEMSH